MSAPILLTAEQAEQVRTDFAADRPSVLIVEGVQRWTTNAALMPVGSVCGPCRREGHIFTPAGDADGWGPLEGCPCCFVKHRALFVAPSRWADLDKPCERTFRVHCDVTSPIQPGDTGPVHCDLRPHHAGRHVGYDADNRRTRLWDAPCPDCRDGRVIIDFGEFRATVHVEPNDDGRTWTVTLTEVR